MAALTDSSDVAHYYFATGLSLARQQASPVAEIRALVGIGGLFYHASKESAALAVYDTALGHCQRLQNRIEEATVLRSMGDARMSLDQMPFAQQLYRSSLAYSKSEGFVLGEATATLMLGRTELLMASREQGVNHIQEALGMFAMIGDSHSAGNAHRFLGEAMKVGGQYEIAEAHYHDAKLAYQIAGDSTGLATIHMLEGNLFERQGKWAEAEDDYDRAMKLYRRSYTLDGMAYSWYDIAGCARHRKDNVKAFAAYDSAVVYGALAHDLSSQGNAHYGAAQMLLQMGVIDSAEIRYDKAMSLYRPALDTLGMGNVMRGRACVKCKRGEYDPARREYVRAREMYSAARNPYGVANTYWSEGTMLVEGGQARHNAALRDSGVRMLESAEREFETMGLVDELGEVRQAIRKAKGEKVAGRRKRVAS